MVIEVVLILLLSVFALYGFSAAIRDYTNRFCPIDQIFLAIRPEDPTDPEEITQLIREAKERAGRRGRVVLLLPKRESRLFLAQQIAEEQKIPCLFFGEGKNGKNA